MELYIYTLIFSPVLAGILVLLIPQKLGGLISFISLLCSLVCAYFSCLVFRQNQAADFFAVDMLNRFIVPAIALFGFLTILYSARFIDQSKINFSKYSALILWTLGAGFGAVTANHWIVLVVFWGFLGGTLYLLINMGAEENSPAAAKKTFIIVGGSDALMILGVVILRFATNTFQISAMNVQMGNPLYDPTLIVVAFVCLLIAAFAKAGAMPFHTWIPDMAVNAPIPVTAFMPACLDKLLGIYLIARLTLHVFVLSPMVLYLLMLLGTVTIIAGVFMALIQHDIRKLLSYHAVSQVGYMLLGIGTGNPVGIAGGLFHMLNNAIYKSCLFFCTGSVQKKTGTTDLNGLGGLATLMPVTFISFLIAALSISGVPPLNGFVSKWMIYQGVIQNFSIGTLPVNQKSVTILFLALAMFGSALTLASFMKLLHAIFLGRAPKYDKTVREVSFAMWAPPVVLAGLCILFGLFAFEIPLKYFISPAVGAEFVQDSFGLWQPGLATIMILGGLFVGVIFYVLSRIKIRTVDPFIGIGTDVDDLPRVTGADFYQTIKDYGFFRLMYSLAEKKVFDVYHWGKNIAGTISFTFSSFHTGDLQTYLAWGIIGLFLLLLKFVGLK